MFVLTVSIATTGVPTTPYHKQNLGSVRVLVLSRLVLIEKDIGINDLNSILHNLRVPYPQSRITNKHYFLVLPIF